MVKASVACLSSAFALANSCSAVVRGGMAMMQPRGDGTHLGHSASVTRKGYTYELPSIEFYKISIELR